MGEPSWSARRRTEPANGPVSIADPTRGIALDAGTNVDKDLLPVGETIVGGEQSAADTRVGDTAMDGRGSPLVVVYWNVAGIPAGAIDSFFGGIG